MDAFNLRYMKRIRFTMRTIGAWPNHEFGDHPATALSPIRRYGYTTFLFTICCIGMVAQAMYLINNRDTLSFVDSGQTLLTFFLCTVYIQRTLLPMQTSYRAVIKEFSLNFNLVHYEDKSDFSAKMSSRISKICEILCTIIHMQIYIASFFFNVVPLIINWNDGMFGPDRPANATFDQSVSYALPFNQQTYYCYVIIVVYNWYVSYNLSCVFCCQDLLIYVIVIHIWGHLKIFEHTLNNFPRPKVESKSGINLARFTEEENKEIHYKLKEIILTYLKIKKFIETTSTAYSETILVYYGYHLVTDCVLLLECSTLDPKALLKYGAITIVSYQQLIELSVVFELISSRSEGIINSVYDLPWECMDNSNSKMVLILLQIVQESVAVKAGGMVPIGLQTIVAVLKASFSYFMMLSAFADD
uniref:Odorant receptor n=1 Tax=Planotortrix excessana TaxID=65035 RepID=A0A0B5CMR8_9NEOP|nr:olfactory receptor OR7 [Planotortrix excessana]